jgi:transcriptional regulator of acetoin/glycerol metabolism
VIERAVLLSAGASIDTLDFSLPQAQPSAEGTAELDSLTLDQAEERMVRRALDRAEGNVQRAAEALGLSRAALYRRLEKFGMRTPEE